MALPRCIVEIAGCHTSLSYVAWMLVEPSFGLYLNMLRFAMDGNWPQKRLDTWMCAAAFLPAGLRHPVEFCTRKIQAPAG